MLDVGVRLRNSRLRSTLPGRLRTRGCSRERGWGRTYSVRTIACLALALLSAASLSCGGQSTAPISPLAGSRLHVFVEWQGQGVAGVPLDILELNLSQTTDAKGITVFEIPAGSYTLRAHLNGPGPGVLQEIPVMTRWGETEHVQVTDCVPCVSAR